MGWLAEHFIMIGRELHKLEAVRRKKLQAEGWLAKDCVFPELFLFFPFVQHALYDVFSLQNCRLILIQACGTNRYGD